MYPWMSPASLMYPGCSMPGNGAPETSVYTTQPGGLQPDVYPLPQWPVASNSNTEHLQSPRGYGFLDLLNDTRSPSHHTSISMDTPGAYQSTRMEKYPGPSIQSSEQSVGYVQDNTCGVRPKYTAGWQHESEGSNQMTTHDGSRQQYSYPTHHSNTDKQVPNKSCDEGFNLSTPLDLSATRKRSSDCLSSNEPLDLTVKRWSNHNDVTDATLAKPRITQDLRTTKTPSWSEYKNVTDGSLQEHRVPAKRNFAAETTISTPQHHTTEKNQTSYGIYQPAYSAYAGQYTPSSDLYKCNSQSDWTQTYQNPYSYRKTADGEPTYKAVNPFADTVKSTSYMQPNLSAIKEDNVDFSRNMYDVHSHGYSKTQSNSLNYTSPFSPTAGMKDSFSGQSNHYGSKRFIEYQGNISNHSTREFKELYSTQYKPSSRKPQLPRSINTDAPQLKINNEPAPHISDSNSNFFCQDNHDNSYFSQTLQAPQVKSNDNTIMRPSKQYSAINSYEKDCNNSAVDPLANLENTQPKAMPSLDDNKQNNVMASSDQNSGSTSMNYFEPSCSSKTINPYQYLGETNPLRHKEVKSDQQYYPPTMHSSTLYEMDSMVKNINLLPQVFDSQHSNTAQHKNKAFGQSEICEDRAQESLRDSPNEERFDHVHEKQESVASQHVVEPVTINQIADPEPLSEEKLTSDNSNMITKTESLFINHTNKRIPVVNVHPIYVKAKMDSQMSGYSEASRSLATTQSIDTASTTCSTRMSGNISREQLEVQGSIGAIMSSDSQGLERHGQQNRPKEKRRYTRRKQCDKQEANKPPVKSKRNSSGDDKKSKASKEKRFPGETIDSHNISQSKDDNIDMKGKEAMITSLSGSNCPSSETQKYRNYYDNADGVSLPPTSNSHQANTFTSDSYQTICTPPENCSVLAAILSAKTTPYTGGATSIQYTKSDIQEETDIPTMPKNPNAKRKKKSTKADPSEVVKINTEDETAVPAENIANKRTNKKTKGDCQPKRKYNTKIISTRSKKKEDGTQVKKVSKAPSVVPKKHPRVPTDVRSKRNSGSRRTATRICKTSAKTSPHKNKARSTRLTVPPDQEQTGATPQSDDSSDSGVITFKDPNVVVYPDTEDEPRLNQPIISDGADTLDEAVAETLNERGKETRDNKARVRTGRVLRCGVKKVGKRVVKKLPRKKNNICCTEKGDKKISRKLQLKPTKDTANIQDEIAPVDLGDQLEIIPSFAVKYKPKRYPMQKAKRRRKREPRIRSDPALWTETENKKLFVCRETGETVLHKAARKGYEKIAMDCLVSGEFDVNVRDNAGYTPLHESCVSGNLAIANALIDRGADPNAKAFAGTRPIHDAVGNNHLEHVRLLLSRGADPTIANYLGRSTIKMARSIEMRDFLNEYIADLNDEQGPWDIPEFVGKHGSDSGFNILEGAPSDTEDSSDIFFDMSAEPLPILLHLRLNKTSEFKNYHLVEDIAKCIGVTNTDDFVLFNGDLCFRQLSKDDILDQLRAHQLGIDVADAIDKIQKSERAIVDIVEIDEALHDVLGTTQEKVGQRDFQLEKWSLQSFGELQCAPNIILKSREPGVRSSAINVTQSFNISPKQDSVQRLSTNLARQTHGISERNICVTELKTVENSECASPAYLNSMTHAHSAKGNRNASKRSITNKSINKTRAKLSVEKEDGHRSKKKSSIKKCKDHSSKIDKGADQKQAIKLLTSVHETPSHPPTKPRSTHLGKIVKNTTTKQLKGAYLKLSNVSRVANQSVPPIDATEDQNTLSRTMSVFDFE